MNEGEKPKVVRMRRELDTSGKPLRKDGPCYLCGQRTAYQFSAIHAHYGDAWIEKQFSPTVRAQMVEALRSGVFLRWRYQGGRTLRQLLKFVCRPCHDEMKHRLWPEAEAREREEAQRRNAAAQVAFEEQRRASPQQRGVRLVAINDG